MSHNIAVLALDLQGTLISNAVSQIPRPGLHDFLVYVLDSFDRVALYTTVSASRTQKIIATLCSMRDAPVELLSRWEHITWSGPVKDLRFIPDVEPSACLIIDDKPERIVPEQRESYIRIEKFTGREPCDRELPRITEILGTLTASK